jgi:hypothetical protein
LPGDFNDDDKVDAADYIVWRKNEATNNALTNDNGLGTPIGAAHYNLWRANFGMTLPMPGAGSGASTFDTLMPSQVARDTTLTAAPKLYYAAFMMLGQRTQRPDGPAAVVVRTAQRTAAIDAAVADSLFVVRLRSDNPTPSTDSARSADREAKDADSQREWTFDRKAKLQIAPRGLQVAAQIVFDKQSRW